MADQQPQIFQANKTVAEQWGVPEATPFVQLRDMSPEAFDDMKAAVWLQLDLARNGVMSELVDHELLPSTANAVVDMKMTFSRYVDGEQLTEQIKRILHRYGIDTLTELQERARIKKAQDE